MKKCPWGDGEMSDFETEWDNYMIAYTATADPVTRGGMKTMGAPDLSATPIYDGGSLQNMSPTGNYYLANDINCVGMTWTPIGSASTPFIGVLDGQGHSIKKFSHYFCNCKCFKNMVYFLYAVRVRKLKI